MRRPIPLLSLAVLLLAGCQTLAPGYANRALEDLFNAERAFARDAYAEGVRPAFAKYFRDDAIVFEPGPVLYADAIRTRPAPADPKALVIEWGPQVGAVSRAGDLGFTTGPTRYSNRATPTRANAYGYYFSVWSRSRGDWKVVLDAGVASSTPPPQQGAPNMRTPIVWQYEVAPTSVSRAAERAALLAKEQAPRTTGVATEGLPSYRDLMLPATLVLRPDGAMLSGEPLRAVLAAAVESRIEWTTLGAVIADSGDLAYTYGTSHVTSPGMTAVDGYYTHVWQRSREGDWRLLADVALAAN